MLPAGLNRDDINRLELYAENGKAKALYRGQTINFFELPAHLINVFRHEMKSMPHRISYLGIDKISNENERLEAYVCKEYGEFDNTPDYDGKKTTPEIYSKEVIEHFGITDRELEVLILVSNGMKTPEISEKLFISAKTAENHINNIKKKLNLNTAVALTRFSIINKIVTI